MTKFKLWITDIDGTIVNYDGSVTQKMTNLIQKINNSDFKMVLSTGRMFMGASHARQRFGIKTPVVCYQGAVVRDEDSVLLNSTLDKALAREVVEYFKSKNIHTHIYSNDTLYIEDDNKKIMDEYCRGRGTEYIVLDDFAKTNFENIPKVLAVIEDKNLMEDVKEELSLKYKGIFTIVQSAPKYLEVTNWGVSKGSALEFLMNYWNISKDEIIASGDQDNDIEMLKKAGVKVCIGDASKELRNISDYSFESVNSDKLPDLIERLVF